MERSLHYLLLADHLSVQKKLYGHIKEMGLSAGQPKILEYLERSDGAMQKDIARHCYIEPATITSLLAGMEKKGLIIRSSPERDRRSLKVFLTDYGKKCADKLASVFNEIDAAALKGFSEKEKEELISALCRIRQNLQSKEKEANLNE